MRPIVTGGAGQYLLYLDEGQRFLLTAHPRYAGRNSGVEYALTPMGGQEPVQSGSLRSEKAQSLYLWLKAKQAGLYVVDVQTPKGQDGRVEVRFDVAGVYPLDQPKPGLPGTGFFFVPKGTKAVGLNITGRAIVPGCIGQGAAGRVDFQEKADAHRCAARQ